MNWYKIAKKKAKWNKIPDERNEGDKLDTQLLGPGYKENRRKPGHEYEKKKGRNYPHNPGND